jgi:hypothetical protein
VKQYEYGRIFNNVDTMFPWFTRLIEDDRAVLGNDWWPYGIGANRKALELITRLRIARLRGQQLTNEDVFDPEEALGDPLFEVIAKEGHFTRGAGISRQTCRLDSGGRAEAVSKQ